MKTLKQKTGIYNDASAIEALEDAYALVDKVDTYVGDDERLDEVRSLVNDALTAIADAIGEIEGDDDR